MDIDRFVQYAISFWFFVTGVAALIGAVAYLLEVRLWYSENKKEIKNG